jgi:hypothetical protein
LAKSRGTFGEIHLDRAGCTDPDRVKFSAIHIRLDDPGSTIDFGVFRSTPIAVGLDHSVPIFGPFVAIG